MSLLAISTALSAQKPIELELWPDGAPNSNGITTPELPELDDEFAKDVSEFDTLDEYKGSLRENLEKRKKDEAENDFRASRPSTTSRPRSPSA